MQPVPYRLVCLVQNHEAVIRKEGRALRFYIDETTDLGVRMAAAEKRLDVHERYYTKEADALRHLE